MTDYIETTEEDPITPAPSVQEIIDALHEGKGRVGTVDTSKVFAPHYEESVKEQESTEIDVDDLRYKPQVESNNNSNASVPAQEIKESQLQKETVSQKETPIVPVETKIQEPAVMNIPAETRIQEPLSNMTKDETLINLQKNLSKLHGLNPHSDLDFLPEERHDISELGPYVTKVMQSADKYAEDYKLKAEHEASRYMHTIKNQAVKEGEQIRLAAKQDADKIIADAYKQAEKVIADRVQYAANLTDGIYAQAESFLRNAHNPEEVRRQLAKFMDILIHSTEKSANYEQ